MLKRKLKRSSKYNEDGALPELIGRDLERNMDNISKMEDMDADLQDAIVAASANMGQEEMIELLLDLAKNNTEEESFEKIKDQFREALKGNESEVILEDADPEDCELDQAIELYKKQGYFDSEENKKEIECLKDAGYTCKTNSRGTTFIVELEKMNEDSEDSEDSEEIETEENLEDMENSAEPEAEDEIPTSLDTEMEEPEEQFNDINEKVVTYLYRGFKELGDNIRVFLEDEENEERDAELVESLTEFMEGYPEVMDFIKDFSKKYISDENLLKDFAEPEEEAEEPEEEEIEDSEENMEDDFAEDLEVVESYIKEHDLEHNIFENEYEVYARYSNENEATKYEEDLKKFKSAEVFRHEDIGEIHAYIRVK